MAPVTTMLKGGVSPAGILRSIFADVDFSIQQERPVVFFCPCSERQIAGMLIGLGREELTRMADEQERVEVVCEYCRKKYEFDRDEIKKLLEFHEKP